MQFKKQKLQEDGPIAYAFLITDIKLPKIQANLSDECNKEIINYITLVKPTYGDKCIFFPKNEKYEILIGILVEDNEKIKIMLAGADALKTALKLNAKKLILSSEMGIEYFAEGSILGNFSFDYLKEKKINSIEIVSETENETFEKIKIISECHNFSRFLAESPANHMTPSKFVNYVREFLEGTEKVVVIEKKKDFAEENKMGLFLSVAAGSDEELRFLIVEYRGRDSEEIDVALVGKGITFDSGGISIKPSLNMEDMRLDIMGGASVIGAVSAIAKLKLKININVFVPLTENLPNGKATKPGDVHFAMNGKSVEINNTDAEGRLVLADALCYAQNSKPKFIIDVATLTGACLIALGPIYSALFCNDESFAKSLLEASSKCCDPMWRMPLDKRFVKELKSDLADIKNTGGRRGGSCVAASFLNEFVSDGIKWAHIDIASVMHKNYFSELFNSGASGASMRTITEFLLEESKKYE